MFAINGAKILLYFVRRIDFRFFLPLYDCNLTKLTFIVLNTTSI